MQGIEWALVLPVAILAGFGLLALVLAPFFRGSNRILSWASVAGVVLTGIQVVRLWEPAGAPGGLYTAAGMVHVDRFGLLFSLIVLIVALLSLLVSPRFLEREEAEVGEFYALLLFAVCGMVVMVNTRHLMTILVGLEIFSLCLYVLCGLTRYRAPSIESALKYLLLGAFSSGFLVYGLALLYGATGSLDIVAIGEVAATAPGPLLWLGMGLVVVGFGFKIAVVPFHQWVPDVYQGAPTLVTGFMAAATKTVAFAALLRFLNGAFGGHGDVWIPMVTWLAVLTMTVANLVALGQTNIKRLLAFSSIAHAGYLMIAVASIPSSGIPAIAYYLLTYAFMTVGAFAVAAAVGRGDAARETGYEISSWAGLGRRQPAMAAVMTVFLLSMAGMPPTGGFLGKYLVFQSAIESKLYLLAVVGMINAVIAAYYYLRVIIAMWMREPDEETMPQAVAPATGIVLTVAAVAIFALGLVPGPILDATRGLASYLVAGF